MTDTRREEMQELIKAYCPHSNEWEREGAARAILSTITPEPEAGWRDMDSAPKDGRPFQAWLSDGHSWPDVDDCWEPRARFNVDSGAFEIWTRVDYDQEGWSSDFNPEWKPIAWKPRPLPPAPGTQPATEQQRLKEAARVVLDHLGPEYIGVSSKYLRSLAGDE